MRRAAAALLAAALAAAARPAEARGGGGGGARGTVVLEGERVQVRWTDGDGFQVLSGGHRGSRVRLAGVNALETYGPVHRIGGAGGEALLAVASGSAAVAAASAGACALLGARDRYGRLLADCPEAARALVRAGHAMVFAVDRPADPDLLALQGEAQRARLGMWAEGAPRLVPTSLHSTAERGLPRGAAYDRVVDTRTGAAELRRHAHAYAPCDEICVGDGADRACMVYVPWTRRYRDRPACLRDRGAP